MERDYWLASSLIGTAVGTIFEGRSWVEELMNCVNSEEVRNLFKQYLDGRFDFWNGSISQPGEATWEEKYGLLSLFRGGSHLMYVCVNRSDLADPSLEHRYPKLEKILERGHAYASLSWISENKIKVKECIAEGYNGDEDGYGVEPDTWMIGYLNKEGVLQGSFEISE